MFRAADLFDLTQTDHAAIFDGTTYAWEALKNIADYLTRAPRQNPPKRFPGASIGDGVFIGEGTTIEPGVLIKGPAIIGKNCQIRHNAYLREQVIIGDGCVVGHLTHLEGCTLEDESLAGSGSVVLHWAVISQGATVGLEGSASILPPRISSSGFTEFTTIT